MTPVLLLDLDHTLYPSTAPTLNAVDLRITRYIGEKLGLPPGQADEMRRDLCARYGTTLRGLEVLHGIGRDEYTDFIQDLEDALMPVADPRLRDWLSAAARRLPAYLFTNARRDWAHRCLRHLGLSDPAADAVEPPCHLAGILDIDFMEWVGKPDDGAFEKAERFLRERHPRATGRIFADDRLDNLDAARRRGWRTIWVRPHDADAGLGEGHAIVDSLLELDPEALA